MQSICRPFDKLRDLNFLKRKNMRKWRIEDSEDLYNVKGWGGNYFSINEKGHMVVTPKEGCASVDLP